MKERKKNSDLPFASASLASEIRLLESKESGRKDFWLSSGPETEGEEKSEGKATEEGKEGSEQEKEKEKEAEARRKRSERRSSRTSRAERRQRAPPKSIALQEQCCSLASSHLSTLETLMSSEHFPACLSSLLLTVLPPLRAALFRERLLTDRNTLREYYSLLSLKKIHSVEEKREAAISLQSEVSVSRNEYIKLVKQYAVIENRLEKAVEEYQTLNIEKKSLQDTVQEWQDKVDSEGFKHERLAATIEETSRQLNNKSKHLFEACNKRKALRVDVRNLTETLAEYKEEGLASDGKVELEKLEEVKDKVKALKDKLSVVEAALQIKQTSYVELLRDIRQTELDFEDVRNQYKSKVEEEKEVERSLTPRPNWSVCLSNCPWLLQGEDNEGKEGNNSNDTSVPMQSESEKSAPVDGAESSRRRPSASNQIDNPIFEESKPSFVRTRRKSVSGLGGRRRSSLSGIPNLGKGAKSKKKEGKDKEAKKVLRPTREGAAMLAQHIETLGLDGKQILQAQMELAHAQEELQAAKTSLEFARSFLPEYVTNQQVHGVDNDAAEAEPDGQKKLHASVRSTMAALQMMQKVTKKRESQARKEMEESFDIAKLFSPSREEPLSLFFQLMVEKNKKGDLVVQGFGKHPRVPPFLRHEGPVPLRLIPRNELIDLVREVWNFKVTKEGQAKQQQQQQDAGAVVSQRRNRVIQNQGFLPCSEAFHQVLKNRYGVQSVVARWAYNSIFSIQQVSWDADLDLFLASLRKVVPDGTFMDQQLMLSTLQVFLRKLSVLENGGSLGEVSKEALFASLRQMFPGKTEDQFDDLELAVHEDQPMSVVFVDLLLDENQDPRGGNTFLNVLKAQHLAEIKAIFKELKERLLLAASMYQSEENCKLEDVVSVMKKCDEHLSTEGLQDYLQACFPEKLKKEEQARHAAVYHKFPNTEDHWVHIDTFIENMLKICYKPTLNYVIDPEPVLPHLQATEAAAMRSAFA